jgi:PAS domain S-box-containing protein
MYVWISSIISRLSIGATRTVWFGSRASLPDSATAMLNSAVVGNVEASICKYEGELRALLDAIPDPVWLKDPDGIYLDCNASFARNLGVSISDIISKTDYDFLDQSLADFVREQDRKACTADMPLINEEWIPFGDGGRCRLYETTKTPMRDSGGKLIGVLGIARDITERAERKMRDERREAGIKRVLDNAADAIFIVGPQGDYQYVNEQAMQLLGYTRDEFLRMRVGDVTPSENSADAQVMFQKLSSTGSLRSEFRFRDRSGVSIPVDFNGTVLPDGRVYISFRDIRPHKLAEAEREQHREALVREVHHRIKNNLQGVAGLLQRELGKFQELDSRLKAAISQINSIAVVHGLQAVHPDEGMRLSASVSNICRIVSELVQRPVLFQCEDEQNTFGLLRVNDHDAVSVALVINELILNAAKHSPPCSMAPVVSLRADGMSVNFLIRNSVAGVPDFNFDTGDKLGTGLSLVRSLLPKQGAHLGYRVDPEGGCMLLTTLHLTAPLVMAIEKQEEV